MLKFYSLKIKDLRHETCDCVSIAFDVPSSLSKEFEFTQGQYLTLRTTIEGEEIRRSYSICSSPFDNELRVAVKQVEDGKFSTLANKHLRKGDLLEVMPPMGHFYAPLDAQQAKHYVFFAAGSGITPIMSNIKAVLQAEPLSICTLIYGNRNSIDIIFKEEIEGLKNKNMGRFQVFHVLSRERTDADLFFGRLNSDKIKDFFNKMPDLLRGDEYFICGPNEIIEAVKNELIERNIATNKIHFELFNAPKVNGKKAASLASASGVATIKIDGLSFEVPIPKGMNVLDAAHLKGADLPYACKGGVCCTCRAKLTEGSVDMEVNFALTEEELEAGFILTCQAHPKTAHITVDFDIK